MKKAIILSGLALITLGLVVYIWPIHKNEQKSIAIITTLSHPALESARQGFIQAFAQKDLNIIDYNAEGNLQQANLIANKISKDNNIVGIFAIGTLAAQTVAKAEKSRPIIIAAVSDPKVIVPNTGADNICGLSDSIDANFQIDTILKLLPKTTSISLLYSPHEANSASMVKQLLRSAEARKLRVALVGIHEPQQIMSASQDACLKSDVVLIPLDNQIVAAMPAVIKATRSMPCPIITSNESPIHQGATLAFGVDYRKSGETAGGLMNRIIDGETTPKNIGFINPQSVDIFINDEVVREKGVLLDPQAKELPVHVKRTI